MDRDCLFTNRTMHVNVYRASFWIVYSTFWEYDLVLLITATTLNISVQHLLSSAFVLQRCWVKNVVHPWLDDHGFESYSAPALFCFNLALHFWNYSAYSGKFRILFTWLGILLLQSESWVFQISSVIILFIHVNGCVGAGRGTVCNNAAGLCRHL